MAELQLFIDGPAGCAREQDLWYPLGDDEPQTSEAAIIVSAARWRAERETLLRSDARLGLRLSSGDAPEEFADDLDYFDLIALHFPRFNDGTCYSYAQLLRRRYRFRGQLRAAGQLLPDQLALMRRCGIDAFETADPRTARALLEGGPPEVTPVYQRAADRRRTLADQRAGGG